MIKFRYSMLVLALATAAASVPASAQDAKKAAPPKAAAGAPKTDAPAAAPASSQAKEIYSQAMFDFLLKERVGAGQPDTPQLRDMIRDELINRELVMREARRKGID